jgi:hypothetical protein
MRKGPNIFGRESRGFSIACGAICSERGSARKWDLDTVVFARRPGLGLSKLNSVLTVVPVTARG